MFSLQLLLMLASMSLEDLRNKGRSDSFLLSLLFILLNFSGKYPFAVTLVFSVMYLKFNQKIKQGVKNHFKNDNNSYETNQC